jgi:hypothetical protein
MSMEERDTTKKVETRETVSTVPRPEIVSEERRRETVEGPVTWEEMRMLLRREPAIYQATWRPTTAGVLSIVGGSLNFLLGIGGIIGGNAISDLAGAFQDLLPGVAITGALSDATITAGIILVILGLISIIGGIAAIARRLWGLALAGSIATMIPTPAVLPVMLGFFSLLFVSLGKHEFNKNYVSYT